MRHGAATTAVRIDARLLERLRAQHPGKSDSEILENVARAELAFVTLGKSQARNSLTEDEALQQGVSAVKWARSSQS